MPSGTFNSKSPWFSSSKMHLCVLDIVLKTELLERLKWESSFLSHSLVKPFHPFSLCSSSDVSSLSSAVASPLWSALCLHSIIQQCQRGGCFKLPSVQRLALYETSNQTKLELKTNLCTFNVIFLVRSICKEPSRHQYYKMPADFLPSCLQGHSKAPTFCYICNKTTTP